jgi:hypothetical protein
MMRTMKRKSSKSSKSSKRSRKHVARRSRKTQRGGVCPCMMAGRGGVRRRIARQRGGDGQETTTMTVQGVPTTDDEKSVVVIGSHGPVKATEFRQMMEDIQEGRLD